MSDHGFHEPPSHDVPTMAWPIHVIRSRYRGLHRDGAGEEYRFRAEGARWCQHLRQDLQVREGNGRRRCARARGPTTFLHL